MVTWLSGTRVQTNSGMREHMPITIRSSIVADDSRMLLPACNATGRLDQDQAEEEGPACYNLTKEADMNIAP